jgi:ABC-2 type transport system permease protein
MGLVYVFLWEGAITGIFHGTRYLSIRHYTIALADWLGDVQPSAFEAYLSGTTALVMTVITITIAVVMAVRKLEEIEVRETT